MGSAAGTTRAQGGGPLRRLIPLAVTIVAGGSGACASPGAPPGGPVDTAAPQLIAVAPESGSVRVTPRAVVFRFDEVVSERPPAVPSLGALFLISPQTGVPIVDWSRSEVSVRPRGGWRANTTYTVTMLPGMADLRGNVSREQRAVVFSTGAEIPQTQLTGRVFDWAAGLPAADALVQAITPDSVVYSTIADSTGVFTLAHLPPGQYLVQTIMDENRNRALDPRERFDTLTVVLRDTLAADFLAYARDSIPPRIASVQVLDSVSLRVLFDLPLDSIQDIATFAVSGPDSILVHEAALVPADTTATPLPRPRPSRAMQLTVTPLLPDATYVVRAAGVRGLTGVAGPSERQFQTPATFTRDTVRAAPP